MAPTCDSPNYGSLEVFVVLINRRTVADGVKRTQVYTCIIFYCWGEASGLFKDNDWLSHAIHVEFVIKFLIPRGISVIVSNSDRCSGQFMNNKHCHSIASTFDKHGIIQRQNFSVVSKNGECRVEVGNLLT